MIAVDTSALMAIVLGEREADACASALEAEDRLLISAGTVAEALIVAARRNLGDALDQLIIGLNFEVVAVSAASARRIAEAYDKWGKGIHPAALNFGDCFAYEVASRHGCRLLYVGEDFARIAIESALSG